MGCDAIAVVIPCHNEAATIADVVAEFRRTLPHATVHVMDNASVDGTSQYARAAGAQVHYVPVPGKGVVVRDMFRRIDADIYLMVDGDGTYPAESAPELIRPIQEGVADMVIANRMESYTDGDNRAFHRTGNRLIRTLVNALFKGRIRDVLSGYRAFTRHFVKTTPILSNGFEVETEMTLQALERNMAILELPVHYKARPQGSHSKLSTLRDGYLILRTIVTIFKDYKPLAFFGISGLTAIVMGFIFGGIVISEFIESGVVTHPSTAVLAAVLCLAGGVAITTGLVLDTINRRSREQLLLLANAAADSRWQGQTAGGELASVSGSGDEKA